MRQITAIIAMIILLIVAACDNSGPNRSTNSDRPLAGGGRFQNDDPAEGYVDSSGVTFPNPDFWEGWTPVFYYDRNCSDAAAQVVINDQAAWDAWWESHVACLGLRGAWGHGHDPNGHPGDSSGYCDTCKLAPPVVDFEHNVVLAINLAYDSGAFCHRSIWIQSIESNANTTTVKYEVSRLDSTCCMMLMSPTMMTGVSPVTAVVAPRPISEHVVWESTEITYDCHGPDPTEPMTLHYTDAPCALGNGEELITDSARWNEWYHSAWACDSARFHNMPYEGPHWWDSSFIGPDGDTSKPWPDTMMWNPYPWWGVPHVDFSTHAVIILRAGEQTRWGGGIWLNDVDRSAGGTTFGYKVMQPGDDCPDMGGMGMMGIMSNPTVAIRVPLPIDPPVIWNRQIEAIRCDWGNDSTGIEPWPWPGRDSL